MKNSLKFLFKYVIMSEMKPKSKKIHVKYNLQIK